MIESFKTLFIHPETPRAIYLDFEDGICINISNLCTKKGIRKLTIEEYLNLLELEKINLHIPYILSLLEQE